MKILVSGLVNIETTVRIEQFPVAYCPVRYPFHGIGTTVSGVGVNVAKAFAALGAEVELLTITGKDFSHRWIVDELEQAGVDPGFTLPLIEETPASVILYDGEGTRQINVDLKSVQETDYPLKQFRKAASGCDLMALCNINFSRALLAPARESGALIATDVHALSDPQDEYNKDFMAASDILFLSHEHLPCTPEDFASQLSGLYDISVVVIGMGKDGALLYLQEEGQVHHVPAVTTRPVVNTIGAGDALFSSFLYLYASGFDPLSALRRAVVFASWKIGEKGAAHGFLSGGELEKLFLSQALSG